MTQTQKTLVVLLAAFMISLILLNNYVNYDIKEVQENRENIHCEHKNIYADSNKTPIRYIKDNTIYFENNIYFPTRYCTIGD